MILVLLRYPQELISVEDYRIPEGGLAQYRIATKELTMAEQLIKSMAGEWKPGDFRDEFRDRLQKVIEKRMKSKGLVTPRDEGEEAEAAEGTTTNVVDFMALLKKSLASNKRTPAKKRASSRAGNAAVKKVARKKSVAKKSPAKKPASRKKSAMKPARRKAG